MSEHLHTETHLRASYSRQPPPAIIIIIRQKKNKSSLLLLRIRWSQLLDNLLQPHGHVQNVEGPTAGSWKGDFLQEVVNNMLYAVFSG